MRFKTRKGIAPDFVQGKAHLDESAGDAGFKFSQPIFGGLDFGWAIRCKVFAHGFGETKNA